MTTLDPSTPAGARALERLDREMIAWLTSVNPDGQPQSSPVWFLWANGEILVYSARRAPRNGNVADQPNVAFNLNTDSTGGDVVTMEGVARIDFAVGPPSHHATYLAKYQGRIHRNGWTPEYFAAEYPVPIRIRPTRWRVG